LAADHDIVDWAEDEGVSGAVSPFKRPQLGPWFKRLDEWDAIAVARFDRISRSVRDFSDLCEWLREHAKSLICLEPPIDLSTPHGRAFAQMLAVFAEYERELIRARVSDKWHELKDAGMWPGGTVDFGRMPVEVGRDGWALVPDPQYQPIVIGMVSRFVAGSSTQMIADWLNAEKVLASRDAQRKREAERKGKEPVLKGTRWTHSMVARVLRSPGLGGLVLSGGDLRRDGDGMLVRLDPLIPEDLHTRLRAALEDRSYRRRNASKLRGVAFCFLCGEPMYSMTTANRQEEHRYYVCRGTRDGQCLAIRPRAEYLEDIAAPKFLEAVGDQKIREPVYIAGTDHSAELQGVHEAIANLEDQYASGSVYAGPDGGERFARLMSRLEERRDRLAAVRSIPARTDYRETEVTFRQRWVELDDQGRRMLMADSGFRLYYARVAVPLEEVRAQARASGVTHTTGHLKMRESNLRAAIRRNPVSPKIGIWQADLAEVTAERARLREVPRYREYMLAPTGARLAHRAGLASAGQPADADSEEDWDARLAPARRTISLRLA
jgi:site-specific DNA recombinase